MHTFQHTPSGTRIPAHTIAHAKTPLARRGASGRVRQIRGKSGLAGYTLKRRTQGAPFR
jgi:hypothetical protein